MRMATTATRPAALVAAALDHVALEGRAGLTVAALLAAIEPRGDHGIRRHVWQLLQRQQAHGVLAFYYPAGERVEEPSAVAVARRGGSGGDGDGKADNGRSSPTRRRAPGTGAGKKRKRPTGELEPSSSTTAMDRAKASPQSGSPTQPEGEEEVGEDVAMKPEAVSTAEDADVEIVTTSAADATHPLTIPRPHDPVTTATTKKTKKTKKTNPAAATQQELVPVDDILLIRYEELIRPSAPASSIVVVACEELRFRALNIPRRAIVAEVGDDHLLILEAVGRARAAGITVPQLVTVVGEVSVKKIHNSLDTLLSYGLVVKRMMIVAKPAMRRLNIVHLPRFASDFSPGMLDPSAEFESDELCKKILCSAAEAYLQKLPTQSSVLYDLGRDLGFQKRHLDVLKNHIVQESKRDESFPLEFFQAILQPTGRKAIEPKILNCVRYKSPSDLRGRSGAPRGIVLEMGLLNQVHGIIEENGDSGTTIIDLRNRMVLPGNKLPYKLVSILAGTYGLRAEAIILGKNKAFKLYPMETPADDRNLNATLSPQQVEAVTSAEPPLETTRDSMGTEGAPDLQLDPRLKRVAIRDGEHKEETFSVRANLTLKVALGNLEVEGTRKRRRDHILMRLSSEKIISISSLRASMFNMEKQLAANDGGEGISSVASNVGMIDIRSVTRIATELEGEGALRLLQLPLPARNVSTKFRALRCVILPGYEQDELFIQGYVKNYCRDERLRRIHQNAEKSEIIRLRSQDSEDDGDDSSAPPVRLRKRRRRSPGHQPAILNSSLATPPSQPCASGSIPQPPEINYRVRRFMSQERSSRHSQQYRRLGFAYGVMYRCKVFHKFLWTFLHEHSEYHLRDEEIDISVDDEDEDGGGTSESLARGKSDLRGVVFSRETVLHQMPVHLYIQVFSGGAVLDPAEFLLVEDAAKNQRNFDVLPATIRNKVWSQESERSAKVLGTLSDLNLIAAHKIGMKNLIRILRAGYTDGRDGILAQALKDNALGGLFRLHSTIRIKLDDKFTEHHQPNQREGLGREQEGVNQYASLRLIGTTEKTYSFGNLLPLVYSFRSPTDVDKYWEALECLCLEKMVMEVPNPRRDESCVREVPKPVKSRARRMFRILGWIPKSQKLGIKRSTDEDKQPKRAGIVSRPIRARRRPILKKTIPSKHATHTPEPTPTTSPKKEQVSRIFDTFGVDEDESLLYQWSNEDERQLLEFFVDNCRSRWKISIPQGLQKNAESIAFRVPWLSRTGFGLVSIARKLGKRKIDVKKRLKEKLAEPDAKLLLEGAKQDMTGIMNPSGLFDEELSILGSPRLTALFRRAVMMIVSPQDEYHPLVAEELISNWDAEEIRLVWRYLWLKNWIVRATERERIRGYCMSQKLQDTLKLTTLTYPLSLFRQAAEQEAMVYSTLEEIVGSSSAIRSRGCNHQSDQTFEAEFPANATPGQCALELGCQVMGVCTLVPEHSSIHEGDGGSGQSARDRMDRSEVMLVRKRNLRFLNYKNQKEGTGFAAHLAKRVPFKNPSILTESWHVETKMNAVTLEDPEQFRKFEAFSTAQEVVDFPSVCTKKRPRIDPQIVAQEICHFVAKSGEAGMTMEELLTQLQCKLVALRTALDASEVSKCLNRLVDTGALICVNGYFDQRYIVKEHGDFWLLRPYSLANEPNKTVAKVIFEGEKDTLSFPWLKMDGTTNHRFLFSIQRKMLSCILVAPGITEEIVYSKMEKLLTLQDTREALSLLVEEGLIYTRALSSYSESRDSGTLLFPRKRRKLSAGPDLVLTNLVGNVLNFDRKTYSIHYFPHLECVQRFGSIIQDYQHEVTDARRP